MTILLFMFLSNDHVWKRYNIDVGGVLDKKNTIIIYSII